jgi:hypothetical protein
LSVLSGEDHRSRSEAERTFKSSRLYRLLSSLSQGYGDDGHSRDLALADEAEGRERLLRTIANELTDNAEGKGDTHVRSRWAVVAAAEDSRGDLGSNEACNEASEALADTGKVERLR